MKQNNKKIYSKTRILSDLVAISPTIDSHELDAMKNLQDHAMVVSPSFPKLQVQYLLLQVHNAECHIDITRLQNKVVIYTCINL